MTQDLTPEQRLFGLRFDVNRSIRYHQRRRRFYDLFNDFSDVIALLGGSAAIYMLMSSLPWPTSVKAIPAAIVTLFSSVNLVMGSSRMARVHQDLARAFIDLEARVVAVTTPTHDALNTLDAERFRIEREEPPVMRVLDSMCHNDTLRAFGFPDTALVKIGWFQRLSAQFLEWNQHTIGPKTTA